MRQDASNSYWIFQSYSTNSLKFINGSLNAKRKAINTKVKGKISKFSSTMSILSVSCILFSLCYYYGTVESHQFPTTLKGFGYGFNGKKTNAQKQNVKINHGKLFMFF